CTLHYLLSGKPPFPGGSSMEKLLKQQLDEPQPITQLRPDVPKTLGSVLKKMLAKRPEDRFATAAETAAALEPFCAGNGRSGPIPAVPARANGHEPDNSLTTVGAPAELKGGSATMSGRGMPTAKGKAPVRFAKPVGKKMWILAAAGGGVTLFCLLSFC